MAYFLYDPVSFLVAILLNFLSMHGVAPLNAGNIGAVFLNLLTVMT